ncbi:cyclic nucleotide-binding domain-containing protein [Candidatus Reidiella endopervernicosa]|uniref:Cyclic nucleotide-binding domain-containing protein n=1 Tax=Candidatus Reidiella endopervernicosa TaxID=2738883 RepID=A0A6N0HT57_9GAMM|nr:cyclic nucleotide-binding domain-containing protein [Candidatus Reidiella endopervernicosa]QKQ25397.1 cyclic nucleotide-binding domain-containing protein [Candidatus Reidiella endopervernicosa]
MITQQGTVANWLYILIEGQAEVVLSSEGEQRQVNIINGGEAGSFFGEMGLLTGAPRAANVIALTDVECYRLDKEAFEQVIKARPVIAEEISRTMAKRDADLSMAKNDLDRETRDRLAAAQHDELLVKIRHFFGL